MAWSDSDRDALVAELVAMIGQRVEAGQTAELELFARRLHGRVLPADLCARTVEDLYGATLAAWGLLTRESPGCLVELFNPAYDRDGWQSSHSILQIRHADMPFIVDSVLIALNRRSLNLHFIHNVVFRVRRTDAGAFVGLGTDAEPGAPEVLIHAEIDRLDVSEIDELERELASVLGELRAVVEDFLPMRERVSALRAALVDTPAGFSQEEVDEAAAFLDWLLDNNFTFLGYREFEIREEAPDRHVIHQVAGSELGSLRARGRLATPRTLELMHPDARDFVFQRSLLTFSKGGTPSRVHRPAYPDYVAFKRFDEHGNVVGEHGFLGLYTSPVYTSSPRTIPMVRRKIEQAVDASGLDMTGYNGKVLGQFLATHPRDELFQCSVEQLLELGTQLTFNHERRRQIVYLRKDPYGLFWYCLVYTPRELYNTVLRERIQDILIEAVQGVDAEFDTYFSESVLVRTQFVLRVDPTADIRVDVEELEARIRDLARNWVDDLRAALVKEFGEQRAREYVTRYGDAFGTAYREHFQVRAAVYDIRHMEELDERGLVMRAYRAPETPPRRMGLKIYHAGDGLPLADMMPLLDNLGLRAIDEHPYVIESETGRVTIHDFELEHELPLQLADVGDAFEDAFIHTWFGHAENDAFNRLVLVTGLGWREVAMLRAYARYLKQIRLGFSQNFIAETLYRYRDITLSLVRYFQLLHDPACAGTEAAAEEARTLRAGMMEALEAVPSLNEDTILRRYVTLIESTLRTSFYRRCDDARVETLAFKIRSADIPNVPRPALPYEIFVYSPEVEGVHLRSGPIARGGLRWSDRLEDYRTEILGLVKAQQVKNAVIVPQGAKGGFVIKQPTAGLDRDALMQLGQHCYRQFIRALLDVTDNIVDGQVVPPPEVYRRDGDDPYLVVAADKGTATFSDIANAIAGEYDFWLGDAFASGGSNGYDHKKMGITARGAWVSVQRHFLERGIDVQREPVTVLGIGDMAGDVFGNGMLLSESIELVAAFNHQHIFIDPDPDAAAGFRERQRLFAMPRSTWEDYDASLLSEGGGIFPRAAKSIRISPQMRERFELDEDAMAPDALIHALLKSPVGLIWNGGIGTYVKASTETHADVGDKVNDSLRIDADQLRCTAIGEGGNLGLTQAARVQASLAGVALNTDFIDNSGGVDCSDHEVNIKILLTEVVKRGELTQRQRNELLETMTEEVAELVLENNYRQAQALSMAERHCRPRLGEYLRFINRMETEQGLSRKLEGLPTDEQLRERQQRGESLSRPELAVLLSYSKAFIKQRLIDTDLVVEPVMARFARSEFPAVLAERFADALREHPLYRNIVATQIANDLVHHMGPTFVNHTCEFVGAEVEEVVRAWCVAVSAFGLDPMWDEVEDLGSDVPAEARLELMLELVRLGRRSTRWFLRHRRNDLDVANLIDHFEPRIVELRELLGNGEGFNLENVRNLAARLEGVGVPNVLANAAARAALTTALLAIVDLADSSQRSLDTALQAYTSVADALGIALMFQAISALPARSHWQSMERDAVLDELVTHARSITERYLLTGSGSVEMGDIEAWLAAQPSVNDVWPQIRDDVQQSSDQDFAMYSMAVRKLGDIVRALP